MHSKQKTLCHLAGRAHANILQAITHTRANARTHTSHYITIHWLGIPRRWPRWAFDPPAMTCQTETRLSPMYRNKLVPLALLILMIWSPCAAIKRFAIRIHTYIVGPVMTAPYRLYLQLYVVIVLLFYVVCCVIVQPHGRVYACRSAIKTSEIGWDT